MLESIFKVSQFYVPKGGSVVVVFASGVSQSAYKTHTVKVRDKDGSDKYILVPCQSGFSGVLPCKFCSNIERFPEHIYRPRKIYAATVYVKLDQPWTDKQGVVHTHVRRMFIAGRNALKSTIDPYINKYGTIEGMKFNIERGPESKNFLGDLYKWLGAVASIPAEIGENPSAYNTDEIFSPLNHNEIDEVFSLIGMSVSTPPTRKSSTMPASQPVSGNDMDIPF